MSAYPALPPGRSVPRHRTVRRARRHGAPWARVRSAALLSPALLGVLALVPACGSDAGHTSGIVVDTLASGAIHVRNPAVPSWSEAEGWELQEITRIGRVEGDAPDAFGQIRGIAVDALGQVLVLDAQAQEVRVFHPDGSHLRTLGGPGNGPGEISNPFGLGIDEAQRIWVADAGNRRYTLWDSAGTLLETRIRPLGGVSFIWTAGFHGGDLLETGIVWDGPGTDPTPALFRLVGSASSPGSDLSPGRSGTASNGFAVDTVPLPLFLPETFSLQENGMTRMSALVPYSPTQVLAVGAGSRLWLGVNDRYRIHLLDHAGDTLRILDRAYQPVPVTPAERDSVLAQEFLEQMREAGVRIDPDRIPPMKPAFEWFTEDDRGHLWVAVPGPPEDPGTRMDVFDPEGRYLGQVTSPGRISPWPRPAIRDGVLWAHVPDELDVPHVIAYRILGYPDPVDP